MAVLPQFDPEGKPGEGAQMGIQAANAAQSWMDQAQNRQMQANQDARQQMASQRAQEEFQATLPALNAKADADRLMFNNKASAAAVEQQFRASHAQDLPMMAQEIMDASGPMATPATQEDGSPDWESRSRDLEALQAKWAGMSILPEAAPYVDKINNLVANAHLMATTQYTLQSRTALAQAKLEEAQNIAAMNAASRESIATTGAAARTGSAQITANARTTAAATGAGARIDIAQMNEFSRAAEDYENAALKETDPVKAAALMQKANAFRDKAQGAGTAARASAAAAKPITVDVGGTKRPVFVDANGNKAYKLDDGTYVPVVTP